MRKNGVNREIYPIEGGICAPEGFSVGSVACGIRDNGERDLALIVSKRKCRTACVYSQLPVVGAPMEITRKHLENGLAQAILVNGGAANVLIEEGVLLADKACRLVEQHCNIPYDDVVIASTGEIGKKLCLQHFEKGLIEIRRTFGDREEDSLAAAQAITSLGEPARHAAFSFDLGDFPCKIGVLYKGSMHVCPNMATTLVFLTTNVNISSEMLQKGLGAAVRDTLNMLNTDGAPSPNDMVCIMANGNAGNCRIEDADSEYDKFVMALRSVLKVICHSIAQTCGEKSFDVRVVGVKSKPLARAIAKTLAEKVSIKNIFQKGTVDIENILYLLCGFDGIGNYSKVAISIKSDVGKFILYEDQLKQPCLVETLRSILLGKNAELCIRIGRGNYEATAYGCIPLK